MEDHLITVVENDDLDNVMLLCECMWAIGTNPTQTRVISLEDIGLSLAQIGHCAVETLTGRGQRHQVMGQHAEVAYPLPALVGSPPRALPSRRLWRENADSACR